MQFRYQIDGMCLLILIWFISRISRDKDEAVSQKLFLKLAYFNIATVLVDMINATLEGKTGFVVYVLINIFCIIYLSLITLTSYLWLIYSSTFTRTKKLIRSDSKVGYTIPLITLLTMIAVSPWTNLIFHIDRETCTKVPGYMHFFIFIVPFFYIIMAAVQSIIAFIYDPETKTVLKQDTIITFIVLPLLSVVSAAIYKNLAVIYPTLTLILAAVSLDLQISQVSADGLTGLNNKRQYLNYINTCLEETNSNLSVYLMIIDIDYFKRINDKFGHSEGDKAIVEVAGLLKKAAAENRGVFLARYGGDEFVFVIKTRFLDEVKEFQKNIYHLVNERNIYTTKKYQLSLSIGYSMYLHEGDTLEALTSRVDDMLYREKEEHHALIEKENKG